MGCLFDDGMTCGGDEGGRGGVVSVWEILMFALWCVLGSPEISYGSWYRVAVGSCFRFPLFSCAGYKKRGQW